MEKREPTSRLEALTCSLRVITQALQEFAGVCKCRVSRGVFILYLAACCTVLRSRWYQSGIRTTESYTLTAVQWHVPALFGATIRRHPFLSVAGCCTNGLSKLISLLAVARGFCV